MRASGLKLKNISTQHLKKRLLRVHLSRELREEVKRRSITIRKGDEVKVLRGSFKGKIGKVLKVDYKKLRVYVEGCTRKTARGEEKMVSIHPSKLMIVKLNLDDKLRGKKLQKTEKTPL